MSIHPRYTTSGRTRARFVFFPFWCGGLSGTVNPGSSLTDGQISPEKTGFRGRIRGTGPISVIPVPRDHADRRSRLFRLALLSKLALISVK